MNLDEFDKKILERLQRDSTIAVAALADQVGLSQSSCWRRINLLEQAGVIRERVALLDAKALGLEVTVFANIKLSAHGRRSLSEFEEAISVCPEVVECYTMSGEMDFLVRIVTRDIEGYERFLRSTLLQMPSVQEVHSHIALSQVKQTTALPLGAVK
ncbi:MAG TPA: Lrp/AsnC family transcriptional regulator [Alphaproteobacteria bacterium]|nr:Lrp/AsnC family transcriptional regulator [Alphaproteobacteria bacterium]